MEISYRIYARMNIYIEALTEMKHIERQNFLLESKGTETSNKT